MDQTCRSISVGATRASKPDGYLLGSYRIATTPSRTPAGSRIGLLDVLGRVTMQLFVWDYCPMIAASVQCDVDGIPKGSHHAKSMADCVA